MLDQGLMWGPRKKTLKNHKEAETLIPNRRDLQYFASPGIGTALGVKP